MTEVQGVERRQIPPGPELVRAYGNALHEFYRKKASPVDALLKRRGFGSTIQFELPTLLKGRALIVAIDPIMQMRPVNPWENEIGKWSAECRQVIAATVPKDDVGSYTDRYLGISRPITVGPKFHEIPHGFNEDEFALGVLFDDRGEIDEVLFQGTLEYAGKKVRYDESVQYSAGHEGFTVAESRGGKDVSKTNNTIANSS